jgi:hypothetical protein
MADDNDDEFSKMFEDLAKLGDEPTPLKPVEEPAPVVVGETPAETPENQGESTSAETPETPAETEELAGESTSAEEYVEPQRLNDADLLSRFAQIVREQPAPQAQTPAASAPTQSAPLFSASELKELEAYEKDWPDVAKAEALRRRAEYNQLLAYVFDQVSQRIAPLEQQTGDVSTRSHLNDLYSLIPDYDQVRDPVLQWVEQQPGYLKAAYQQVTRQGTPAEIADLVGRYKQSAGVPATIVAPAAPALQVRKAAAALAPVKSARSGAVDAAPEDFSSAFDAFAKAV